VSSDEVIVKVFEILGPDAEAHRRKVERAIRLGLGYVSRISKDEMASGRYGVVTDEQKKAAGKVVVAIHRLQAALRNPDLVRNDLLRYSPVAPDAPDEDHGPLRYSSDAALCSRDAPDAADADDAFERFNADLEWLHRCYEADAQTPLREKPYRAVDWSQHEAAKTAAKVCKICGLPLTGGKTSKFVKITALICAKEGADLRKVCDKVRRELPSE
jgi:hypothetical protein